ALTSRFEADYIARTKRALCLSRSRKLPEAVEEMRQAARIVPTSALFQSRMAIYAAYAGELETAIQGARAINRPTDLDTLALGFAELAAGRTMEATKAYKALETMSLQGRSWSASGLADIALYEGRLTDAARQLQQGVEADLTDKNSDKAARKLLSLA